MVAMIEQWVIPLLDSRHPALVRARACELVDSYGEI